MLLLVSFHSHPAREKMGGQLSEKKQQQQKKRHGNSLMVGPGRPPKTEACRQSPLVTGTHCPFLHLQKIAPRIRQGTTSISPTWYVKQLGWDTCDFFVNKLFVGKKLMLVCGNGLKLYGFHVVVYVTNVFDCQIFSVDWMLKRQDSLKRQAQYGRNPASPGILQTIYSCIK